MALYSIPDSGLPLLLNWLFRADTGTVESLALRLYTNDLTPDRSSVTGDFVEATFAGYSQRILSRSAWASPTIDAHVARLILTAETQDFVPTADGPDIYGAFVVGVVSNTLYSARRFAEPRAVVNGVTLRVAPVFSMRSRAIPE
jgi:hypothetical protein